MNKKALMRSSSILIGAIFLVFFLLVTLKPASPGDLHCIILPDTEADRKAYGCEGLKYIGECSIWPDPGSSGCECAQSFCIAWCQNNICDWDKGVTVSRAVCNIETAMPHCVGGVNCPLAGEPCKGVLCGLIPAGGCCVKDSDCVTYTSGGPSKCTIESVECFGYSGYITRSSILTLNNGLKCDCANLGEPCGTSQDCCDSNHVCTNGTCTGS